MSIYWTRSQLAARLRLVDEHIRRENAHDLDGILATFGAAPDLTLNGETHGGRDTVRTLYEGLLHAFPDLQIEVIKRYVAEETVVAELVLKGTQRESFLGVPPTGRHVEIPTCAIFRFDHQDTLAGETIYIDATVLRARAGFLSEAA
jgi:steroid delta-isomerase-like uncharacterized protein